MQKFKNSFFSVLSLSLFPLSSALLSFFSRVSVSKKKTRPKKRRHRRRDRGTRDLHGCRRPRRQARRGAHRREDRALGRRGLVPGLWGARGVDRRGGMRKKREGERERVREPGKRGKQEGREGESTRASVFFFFPSFFSSLVRKRVKKSSQQSF